MKIFRCKKKGLVSNYDCDSCWHELNDKKPKWFVNYGVSTQNACIKTFKISRERVTKPAHTNRVRNNVQGSTGGDDQ